MNGMSGIILLVLIFGVLYIAFTYFKTSGNSYSSSDDLTTRPFGGGSAGNNGVPPELENTEDESEMGEIDEAWEDDVADKVNDAGKYDETNEADKYDIAGIGLSDSEESADKAEPDAAQAADEVIAPDEAPAADTPVDQGVVIDSEVQINARMSFDQKPSDTKAASTPDHKGK